MYSQTHGDWAYLAVSDSNQNIAEIGCLTMDTLYALVLAGYEIDPVFAIGSFNTHGVYTTTANKPSGRLIWTNVQRVFPQFHYGSGPYQFVQVTINGAEHWLLKYNGTYYDPNGGVTFTAIPGKYKPTGIVRSASIDPAPIKVMEDVTPPAPSLGQFKVNEGVRLNIRNAPFTNCLVLAKLAPGTVITPIERVQGQDVFGDGTVGWYKVATETVTGWVYAGYLTQV